MVFKSSRIYSSIVTAFLMCSIVPSVMATPITVIQNRVNAATYDDDFDPYADNSFYDGTSTSLSQILTSSNGKSSNTTTINYSSDATSAIFSVDMLHTIDNTLDVVEEGVCCDSAYTENSRPLFFTADVDTTYAISGFYRATGDTLRTYTNTNLFDFTTSTLLMHEQELSDNAANESFTIDGNGTGDTSNIIFGSLTGNLLAGHSYSFYFEDYIQAYNGSTEVFGAATATGNVTLTIGTPTSVPEPSLLALLSLGLVSMVATGRRRKH